MTVKAPPADDLKLMQLARRATAECRSPDEPVERFISSLIAPVREWCVAHADRVQRAYVCPPKDGCLWVYVIARKYRDYALDHEVSRLTDVLRENGWQAFASHLPPPTDEHSFRSFYNPDTAVVAYADR